MGKHTDYSELRKSHDLGLTNSNARNQGALFNAFNNSVIVNPCFDSPNTQEDLEFNKDTLVDLRKCKRLLNALSLGLSMLRKDDMEQEEDGVPMVDEQNISFLTAGPNKRAYRE